MHEYDFQGNSTMDIRLLRTIELIWSADLLQLGESIKKHPGSPRHMLCKMDDVLWVPLYPLYNTKIPLGKNANCHIQHASLWHEANSCKHVAHIFEQIHVNMLLISSQVLHSRWTATADMTLEGYKSFLEFVWWLFLANLLHVTLLLYWDFVFFVGSCSLNLGSWFVPFFYNGILNLPELNIYY